MHSVNAVMSDASHTLSLSRSLFPWTEILRNLLGKAMAEFESVTPIETCVV